MPPARAVRIAAPMGLSAGVDPERQRLEHLERRTLPEWEWLPTILVFPVRISGTRALGEQGKQPSQEDDKKGRGMQEGPKDDEGRDREAEVPDRQDEDLRRPVRMVQGEQRGEAGRPRQDYDL